MSNSIAPGSSADVNVKVTALTTNPNVPVTYKTIILKKNLVNGVNTLTQEMISAQNTKYVVKYDYILGEDIDVPNNCVLEFDGGSLSGAYTVTGKNTNIVGLATFSTDITFAGTFDIKTVYVDWFVHNVTSDSDKTNNIQKAINLAVLSNSSLTFGSYGYNSKNKYFIESGGINITGLRQINGNGSRIITTGTSEDSIFISDYNHVPTIIKDLSFIKAGSEHTKTAVKCNNDTASVQFIIENCYFEGFNLGILINDAKGYIISNNHFKEVNIGVRFNIQSENLTSCNCIISKNFIRASNRCITLETTFNTLLEGFVITDNILYGEDSGIGVLGYNLKNSIISNNIIDHCTENINLQQTLDWITISNNYIGSKAIGIHLYGFSANLLTVSNNKIYNINTAVRSILFENGSNVNSVISKNLIDGIADSIVVDGGIIDNLQLISNVFINTSTPYWVRSGTVTNLIKKFNIGLANN